MNKVFNKALYKTCVSLYDLMLSQKEKDVHQKKMLHTFGSIGQIRFRYHLIIFDLKRNTVCSSYCNMLMRLFGLLILSNCTWCTPVCCTVTDRIITKLFWK